MNAMPTFFYCYSKDLRNYLHDNGFNHNCSGLHLKTHKPFWQFTQSSALQHAISDFQSKRNTSIDSTLEKV